MFNCFPLTSVIQRSPRPFPCTELVRREVIISRHVLPGNLWCTCTMSHAVQRPALNREQLATFLDLYRRKPWSQPSAREFVHRKFARRTLGWSRNGRAEQFLLLDIKIRIDHSHFFKNYSSAVTYCFNCLQNADGENYIVTSCRDSTVFA